MTDRMWMSLRGLLIAPLAVLLAFTGCGPAPTPVGSAAPGGTAAPVESSSVEHPVTRILITTDVVHFGDEVAWRVDGFAYDDPHDTTIAKLTAVFGVEPIESAPGQYDWGGFLLYFSTDASLPSTMGVQVTVAEIGGVEIFVGGEDIKVGTPWGDVEAAADRIVVLELDGMVTEARFDVVDLSPNEARFIAVYGAETGAVTQITGPITAGSLE